MSNTESGVNKLDNDKAKKSAKMWRDVIFLFLLYLFWVAPVATEEFNIKYDMPLGEIQCIESSYTLPFKCVGVSKEQSVSGEGFAVVQLRNVDMLENISLNVPLELYLEIEEYDVINIGVRFLINIGGLNLSEQDFIDTITSETIGRLYRTNREFIQITALDFTYLDYLETDYSYVDALAKIESAYAQENVEDEKS